MNVTRKILPILLLASMILTSGVVKKNEKPHKKIEDPTEVRRVKKKSEQEDEPCLSCSEDKEFSSVIDKVSLENRTTNKNLSEYYPTSDDPRKICMSGYVFDPLERLNVSEDLKTDFHKGKNYVIIQLNGKIYQWMRDEIEGIVNEIYGYIPHHAYLVSVNLNDLKKLYVLSYVRAVIPYHPVLKLQPTIGKHELIGVDDRPENGYRLMITLFPDADEVEMERKIGDLSMRILDKSYEYSKRIVVDVYEGTEKDIARIEGVRWISERGEYFTHNYRHRMVTQTGAKRNDKLYSNGLHGNNQILAIMDSGLRTDHLLFDCPTDKIVSNTAYGGGNVGYCNPNQFYSHGTHTTATGVGCYNSGNSKWCGVADQSYIIFQDIGSDTQQDCSGGYLSPPLDLHSAFINARSSGAYVHSNSWGGSGNEYEDYCIDVDDYMWNNQDFLIISSTGNDGDGHASGSIDYFSTAKNLIAVGATGMPIANEPNDSFDYRTGYSSFGPIYDGRTGPTIVNVAGVGNTGWNSDSCWTISASSQSTNGLVGMSGTSMAAPGVAGAALLVRQYYGEGFYPSGSANASDSIKPSAALIKATMVAGADHLGNPVSDELGYGRINLDTALYFDGDTTNLIVRDCDLGLTTGNDSTYVISVNDPTKAFQVILVWTDYPASYGANPALINDLNLEVVDPSSNSYKGNYFSGGSSQPGGSYDDLNTVEMVYIDPSDVVTGDYEVIVHGNSISYGPQPFALAMTGVITCGNQPPNKPSLRRIFNYAIYNDYVTPYECTLSVVGEDLDGNQLEYEIQWDTDTSFSSAQSKTFGNYASGAEATTTVSLDSGDPEQLYFWKARARDPFGSNSWGVWSDVHSFVMDMELGSADPYWYQFAGEQLGESYGSNAVLQDDSVVMASGDYISYWDPNASAYYYVPQPDDYDDSLFTVRFTPVNPGTLATAYFWFAKKTDVDPAGGDVIIHVWDDNAGMPGTELGNVTIPLADADTSGSATVVDLTPLNIHVDPSSDYYVGYSPSQMVNQTADTLGLILDQSGLADDRSYDMYANNGWEHTNTWISGCDWLISTEVIYDDTVSGHMYSPPVSLYDLRTEAGYDRNWGSMSWTKATGDDSVGLQVQYKSGTDWLNVSDFAVPGNSTGNFNMGAVFGEIDLSSVSTTRDTLRLHAIFKRYTAKGKTIHDPALKMWALGGGSVTHVETSESPRVFALKRNKPNPFTGKTEIRYQIPEREKVELKIYDVMGRSVKTLMNKEQKPGFYAVSWRGTDKKNKKLPAGIYFLRMEAGDYLKTHKMLMLR